MYSDAEIREKQQLARAAGLSGAELLDDVAAIKKRLQRHRRGVDAGCHARMDQYRQPVAGGGC